MNRRARSKLGYHCAIFGSPDQVEMHHVRHIRKLGEKVQGFTRVMAATNRKQISVCFMCHLSIHNGGYDGLALSDLADRALAEY